MANPSSVWDEIEAVTGAAADADHSGLEAFLSSLNDLDHANFTAATRSNIISILQKEIPGNSMLQTRILARLDVVFCNGWLRMAREKMVMPPLPLVTSPPIRNYNSIETQTDLLDKMSSGPIDAENINNDETINQMIISDEELVIINAPSNDGGQDSEMAQNETLSIGNSLGDSANEKQTVEINSENNFENDISNDECQVANGNVLDTFPVVEINENLNETAEQEGNSNTNKNDSQSGINENNLIRNENFSNDNNSEFDTCPNIFDDNEQDDIEEGVPIESPQSSSRTVNVPLNLFENPNFLRHLCESYLGISPENNQPKFEQNANELVPRNEPPPSTHNMPSQSVDLSIEVIVIDDEEEVNHQADMNEASVAVVVAPEAAAPEDIIEHAPLVDNDGPSPTKRARLESVQLPVQVPQMQQSSPVAVPVAKKNPRSNKKRITNRTLKPGSSSLQAKGSPALSSSLSFVRRRASSRIQSRTSDNCPISMNDEEDEASLQQTILMSGTDMPNPNGAASLNVNGNIGSSGLSSQETTKAQFFCKICNNKGYKSFKRTTNHIKNKHDMKDADQETLEKFVQTT